MKQYELGLVRIRTKKISNGRLSLLLDTYKAYGNNNYSKTIYNLIRHLTIFAPNTQLRGYNFFRFLVGCSQRRQRSCPVHHVK